VKNEFIESVKRLYDENYIDKDKVLELKQNGELIIEEVNYILTPKKNSNKY
jgi:hypothetical protein